MSSVASAGAMDAGADAASEEANGPAAPTQADFPKLSLSAYEGVDRADQSDSTRLGELLCGGPLEPLLRVYPRLGGEEGSEPSGESQPAPRLRVEAVA